MQDTLYSLLLGEWRRFALALLALLVATALALLIWLHPPLAGLSVLLLPVLVLFGYHYFVRLRRMAIPMVSRR